jgi:uncharacterized protein (DUF2147 family)
MMKKIFVLLLVAVMALPNLVNAQKISKQDKVLGKWFSEDKKGVVEIYKVGNKYNGKIVEILDKNAERYDINNPDPSKRKQSKLGLVILKNFVFDDDEWEDGTIYDPKNGKTYSCVMELENDNVLEITGYIGITLFGRTAIWTRKLD